MKEPKLLFFQYDPEPIQVDSTGSRSFADLIKKGEKEISPKLD